MKTKQHVHTPFLVFCGSLLVFAGLLSLLWWPVSAKTPYSLGDVGNTSLAAYNVYLPCISNNVSSSPCNPGRLITDAANDVSPAYIDVLEMQSSLSGVTLSATMHLRDIPATLTFNRIGVPLNYTEYGWMVYIDTDNNPATGDEDGAEYILFSDFSVDTPDTPVELSILDAVEVFVMEYEGAGVYGIWSDAVINVDLSTDTLTLIGDIPGITLNSRIFFWTYDFNPGGSHLYDNSPCRTGSVEGNHVITSLLYDADKNLYRVIER
jgi:hypothetical protein